MGSPSGKPSPEALRIGKSAEGRKTLRGLEGLRRDGYCAELIEDASLVELYESARSPCCAISLAAVN